MVERSTIEIYPVGFYSDFKRKRVLNGLRYYLLAQVRKRNWRAVRNYFNGYLAEIHYPPESLNFYRCGRGWTRKSAASSLGRRLAEDNPYTPGMY